MVAPDVAHAQSTTDYDSDDDGLIEVANLAQLNAIRWDLDGNGSAASGSDTTNYTAAFPNAASGMGCPTSGSPTGCVGYELTADLDFDTNDDGTTWVAGSGCTATDGVYSGTCDDYWNDGAGWLPIGTSSSTFDAKFDGGGHIVSKLWIKRFSGDNGLFGAIGADGEVSNLGLVDGEVNGGANVGGLAGQNAGTITASSVYGSAIQSAVRRVGPAVSTRRPAVRNGSVATGGLVGNNSGTITGSYAESGVYSSKGQVGGQVGGLVGVNSGTITDSYTRRWAGSFSGGNGGGLVGRLDSSGSITDSYSEGYVYLEPDSGGTVGGLVGAKSVSATVTTSYWSNNLATSAGGTFKTTRQLQTPTSNTGIYSDWATTRWDFVDANNFPRLKADWDGDGTATWGEFGDQDPEPEFADDAAIDDMFLRVGTAFTSPAIPEVANEHRFFHLIPRVSPTLPDGLARTYDFDEQASKISGTPTSTLARTQFTWSIADRDDGVASLTFYLTVSPAGDYDFDDDGLIEVANLAQLNAIRWDLDGDGSAASGSDSTNYAAAFPSPVSGMGCNEDETDAADQVCEGYELIVDLDFDTNDDGTTAVAGTDCTATSGVYSGTCDDYWNDGAGWLPIGTSSGPFNTEFDGGGHVISNLFIDRSSGDNGLFGAIGADGEVSNLGLTDADASGGANVGGLAGQNAGTITASFVDGRVSGSSVWDASVANGGLVGDNSGTISGSYAISAVFSFSGQVGGLVGVNSGTITDSYTDGHSVSVGGGNVGGLVGRLDSSGSITDSYSRSIVRGPPASGSALGGLVGAKSASSTVTASYWSYFETASAGGTRKTTSELQTPTSNTGIYADWATARWDFVDANHFPLLKADWDGDGTATWGEFGDQDPEPEFADDAAIADMVLTVGAAFTSPALPTRSDLANGHRFFHIGLSTTPSLPDGLGFTRDTVAQAYKISGTPTAALARTKFTWNIADLDDGVATLSFYLTVLPAGDYDSDDDGLIEIANLAQLNAVRWDLDGDGTASSGAETTYAAAFPSPVSGMGCNEDETDAADQVCEGYELIVDLDFDTNDDGKTREAGAGCTATNGVYSGTCDDYWNDGAGWLPIGTSSGAFNAKFDGGGHVISNLFIDRSSGDYGLFGAIGADGEVSNLGMVDVFTWDGGANVGGLAGQNAGTITASFVDGRASGSSMAGAGVATGGLVGDNSGTITGSYTIALVQSSSGQVGGLVGVNSGTITDSYVAGNSGSPGGGNAGGLVGRLDSSGSITDSYSVGHVWGEPASGSVLGGLVGAKSASSTVTASYWLDYLSLPTSAGGTRKSTSELQTPTSNTGIYADWATTRWDFVDADNWPLLKADWDGDGTATWGEFGDQDPEPEFADDAAIADMVLTVGTPFTSPLLPDIANHARFQQFTPSVVPSLPDGLERTWDQDAQGYKISGTPTTVLARTKFTLSIADGDDGVDSLTFYLTVGSSSDLRPVLGVVADKVYPQGAAVNLTLPAATGGDGHPSYVYTLTPDVSGIGLAFNASTRKLTGTPSAPRAKVSFTYTATESSDPDGTVESASRTFTIGVRPKKPANFSATAGDTTVALSWAAIPGVSGWEVKQGSGSWTAIAGSDATTNSHTVTGLTNGTAYTFEVRAFVGSGNARVDGVESGEVTETPVLSSDKRPVLGAVSGKVYVQGEAVDFTLPAATSGDSHPNYVYTLAPDVSGVGLSFDASTRKLSGTPSAPKAKVSFTFTATESSDPDGTVESAARTFTIGVQPKEPANFTVTVGETTVDLSWVAIAGVSGWEVKQGSGSWTVIAGSDATTNGHTVTGLTNDTAYTFEVRAFVGSGDARVGGVESDEVTVTTLPLERRPVLAGVADKVYPQGEVVNFTLPTAAGGDGHPSYVYTLTPDVSAVGLAFNASTRTLSGTLSAPKAKVSFTYTATEAADPDGTVESASRTFTIGVRPKKPENFSVTADGGWAVLSWTAIGGVDGWQVKQGSGTWKTIGRSGPSTSRTAISLAGGAAYTFKVRAFVGAGDTRVEGVESDAISGTLAVDYDLDDDGLIDISSLAQIRASRLDKNGDGVTDDPSMQGLYNRAFPGAADRMGCPSACTGYELATDDLTPRPRG